MKLFFADILNNIDEDGQIIGHFISLASQWKQMFANRCEMIIAGGEGYKRSFSSDELYVLPFESNKSETNKRKLWKMIKNAYVLFKKSRKQTVVLQYSKPFSNNLAILFAYRHCRLFLFQYSTAALKNRTSRLVWCLIKHRVNGIICPNEEIGKAFKVPYIVTTDYIYNNTQNHNIEYEDKIFDFCMVGRITGAKGVIEAVRHLRKTKFKVIVAGIPTSRSIGLLLKKLCKDAQNITLNLRYLDEQEYKNILAQSRYAMLNYSDWYSTRSSGAVFDALFNDVPVVGRRCKTLQYIEDSSLGVVYDDLKELDLEEILNPERYKSFQNNISAYKAENMKQRDSLFSFIAQTL